MLARIYQPARTSMQSGMANTKRWVLEFEAETARKIDPLMGWTSSFDTREQVSLQFDTQEEAVAYAEKHAIAYQIFEPKKRKTQIKAYADNFKHDRKEQWTH